MVFQGNHPWFLFKGIPPWFLFKGIPMFVPSFPDQQVNIDQLHADRHPLVSGVSPILRGFQQARSGCGAATVVP